MPTEIAETPIEYVKGIGPKRAEWLRGELGIHTAGDLLEHLPFRYEDRTGFASVAALASDAVAIQLQGVITAEIANAQPCSAKMSQRIEASCFIPGSVRRRADPAGAKIKHYAGIR